MGVTRGSKRFPTTRRHLKLPRPLIPMTRAITRRKVSGDIRRVVVVGAGLAGLTAAARLRASGLDVTLVEASEGVGGRCRTETLTSAHGEFQADTGATVLTMPSLIEASVHALGQRMPESWKPRKLAPAYTAEFASGRRLEVYSDEARMSAEIAEFARAKAQKNNESDADARAEELVEGYRQHRAWAQNMFDAAYENFLAADFDSLLDLVSTPAATSDLLRLLNMGAFGSLQKETRAFIDDEELDRLFTFQALYAGTAPKSARAVYSVISHMDTGMGVFYPQHSISEAAEVLADALRGSGVEVRLGTRIRGFEQDQGTRRITGVQLDSGETLPADAVISTVDLAVMDRLIAPGAHGSGEASVQKSPSAQRRWSPSAVVVHGSIPTDVSERFASQSHHTLSFGEAWDQTFAEITAPQGKGRLMSDPSLLITRPAMSAPGRRFRGADGQEYEPISILAPAPNLSSAPIAWDKLQDRYVRELLQTLEARGFADLQEQLAIARVETPATWQQVHGFGEGTPFSLAHTFKQTGPFRTRNFPAYGIENLVLAGAGTTPGVGVPTVILSGALAARRITGGGVR